MLMSRILILIRKENSDLSNKKYIDAVERGGGSVVLIYDSYSIKMCHYYLKNVSGILLPGGDCVGVLDFFLIKYAIKHKLSLLGICQGMQSMALYGSNDKLLEIGNYNHKKEEGYVHSVELVDSKIINIYGRKEIMVNSHHLQTVAKSHNFLVVGKSSDGLIEAIESNNELFQIGVQWHPERMIDYDEKSLELFKTFIGQ